MKAPSDSGNKVAFFQLMDRKGTKIGTRLWADVIVKPSIAVKEQKEPIILPPEAQDIAKMLASIQCPKEYESNMKELIKIYPNYDITTLIQILGEKKNNLEEACAFLLAESKIQQSDDLIICLLYTSDAADDTPCVDLGGRRIIKKKNLNINIPAHATVKYKKINKT
eukprot:TRINITY_DN1820_c0_g1_i5.p2 TRINITY_DN1820_c0_g1~~TRINITY_DN1820_c0_g1_i5.p2  ORF type:complete len:167 (+),score=38.47 TRINITY_DN1820_c0_g1_i5:349-849(+)